MQHIKPVIKGFKEINIVKQHIFSLKSIPVITIKKEHLYSEQIGYIYSYVAGVGVVLHL